jgi:hypothetical protein
VGWGGVARGVAAHQLLLAPGAREFFHLPDAEAQNVLRVADPLRVDREEDEDADTRQHHTVLHNHRVNPHSRDLHPVGDAVPLELLSIASDKARSKNHTVRTEGTAVVVFCHRLPWRGVEQLVGLRLGLG